MLRFNDIADRVLDYSPNADLQLLQKAYVFSAKVHEGQERLSGEPYLVHPLEVAGILPPVGSKARLLIEPVQPSRKRGEGIR